jgi:type IV secretion system protein VirB9
MKNMILPTAVSLLALGACAGRGAELQPAAASPGTYAQALRVEEPLARPASVPVASLPPPEDQRLSAGKRSSRRGRQAPTASVEAANRTALREPKAQGYVNAVQVYQWTEGALYRLYTAPERVTEIALQPGETLISVAAGDTVRWIIGDTSSGAGAARRTHILVKPSATGLRTNLVITTDRRVYHLQVESTARTAMASISWTYTEGELLAVSRGEGEPGSGTSIAEGVAVEALNFGYRIEGDNPAWRPIRAFDDGRQVFIEFPSDLERLEAPPLFVLGAGGRTELVNYRLRGRYYVIDRLFEAVELRLGERRQQVVRIIRTNSDQRRRRRGRAS